jgi:hypothetical protein
MCHVEGFDPMLFVNRRAEWWWKLREALDPATGEDLALPPDQGLLADLCAPRWKLSARGVQVESKEDIIKRLGRSPDRGDSAAYALARDSGPATFGKNIWPEGKLILPRRW